MAIASHRIAGLATLRRRLASLPATVRAAIAPALQEVATGLADDIRSALEHDPGPTSPGSPPADPTGRLAASVTVGGAAVTVDGAQATVTVEAPYAVFLEYGTARMAARPVLRPAAQRAGRTAPAILAAALRRELQP